MGMIIEIAMRIGTQISKLFTIVIPILAHIIPIQIITKIIGVIKDIKDKNRLNMGSSLSNIPSNIPLSKSMQPICQSLICFGLPFFGKKPRSCLEVSYLRSLVTNA